MNIKLQVVLYRDQVPNIVYGVSSYVDWDQV